MLSSGHEIAVALTDSWQLRYTVSQNSSIDQHVLAL